MLSMRIRYPEEPANPSDGTLIALSKCKPTLPKPQLKAKPDLARRKVLHLVASYVCHCLLSALTASDIPTAHLLSAGFVEEMRFVAMKLHTKDQAPKEGGKEAAPKPFQKVVFSMNHVMQTKESGV